MGDGKMDAFEWIILLGFVPIYIIYIFRLLNKKYENKEDENKEGEL